MGDVSRWIPLRRYSSKRRTPKPIAIDDSLDGEGQNRTGDTTIFSGGSRCDRRAGMELSGEISLQIVAIGAYGPFHAIPGSRGLVDARWTSRGMLRDNTEVQRLTRRCAALVGDFGRLDNAHEMELDVWKTRVAIQPTKVLAGETSAVSKTVVGL